MATLSSSSVDLPVAAGGRRNGVLRLTAAGGFTAAIVFVLCWLGTFVPFGSPTHAYIGLFTPATASSIDALLQGTLWSLLFGGLVGAVFAIVYNLCALLEPRQA